MYDFLEIPGCRRYIEYANKLLISTLSGLFSAKVRVQFRPFSELLYYGIDISQNPKRDLYVVNNNTVLLICRVPFNGDLSFYEDVYYLAIVISANQIGGLNRIFQATASAVSITLKQCAQNGFRDSLAYVGDRLVVRIIGKYLESKRNDWTKLTHLVEKFLSLRSTTFEGKHFSTGIIVTHSLHAYQKGEGRESRDGKVIHLHQRKDFFNSIDNRYWYMADGFRTYYITDLKSKIEHMFIYSNSGDDHVKKMILFNTLKGGDCLFRTEAGREVSVITSDGVEFINQENIWRFRDYNLLKQRITNEVAIEDDVYNSLIYFVLHCSKNDISSLIWLPKDMATYLQFIKSGTTNVISDTCVSITNQAYSPLIIRMLSSDGATIINSFGEIVAYGSIVDTTKAKPKGVKGTGETAAGLLAENGVAIKISQDGTIKIYLSNSLPPIKF